MIRHYTDMQFLILHLIENENRAISVTFEFLLYFFCFSFVCKTLNVLQTKIIDAQERHNFFLILCLLQS